MEVLAWVLGALIVGTTFFAVVAEHVNYDRVCDSALIPIVAAIVGLIAVIACFGYEMTITSIMAGVVSTVILAIVGITFIVIMVMVEWYFSAISVFISFASMMAGIIVAL